MVAKWYISTSLAVVIAQLLTHPKAVFTTFHHIFLCIQSYHRYLYILICNRLFLFRRGSSSFQRPVNGGNLDRQLNGQRPLLTFISPIPVFISVCPHTFHILICTYSDSQIIYSSKCPIFVQKARSEMPL